ncbi:MAG: hypothetical protein V1838_01655, partial [Patescibacteria group bacterium]
MKKIKNIALLSTVLMLVALPVAAQTSFSIENVGASVGLGTADLKDTVVNIIQWVLGILAL